MLRSVTVKIATGSLILIAAILGFMLAFTFSDSSSESSKLPFPGIQLGLTAEATAALQAGSPSFPSAEAGFSAYHRACNTTGCFTANKDAIDAELLNVETPTVRRAGIASLIKMEENFSVLGVPIKNINGMVTTVNLYYDDEGWIVA